MYPDGRPGIHCLKLRAWFQCTAKLENQGCWWLVRCPLGWAELHFPEFPVLWVAHWMSCREIQGELEDGGAAAAVL